MPFARSYHVESTCARASVIVCCSSRSTADPRTRRIFWKISYDHAKAANTGNRTNSPPYPSLERNILTKYIPDTLPTEDDSERIDEAFGDWPDLVQCLKDKDEVPWAGIVALAWSDVRKDLDSWEAVEDEQRRQTALAAFAVATIVDDERILRVAVERVSELKREFGDVLDEDDADSENRHLSCHGRRRRCAVSVGTTSASLYKH